MKKDFKNVIIYALEQSVKSLEEIPVKTVEDCRRKTMAYDNILGVCQLIRAMEITAKGEETDGIKDNER